MFTGIPIGFCPDLFINWNKWDFQSLFNTCGMTVGTKIGVPTAQYLMRPGNTYMLVKEWMKTKCFWQVYKKNGLDCSKPLPKMTICIQSIISFLETNVETVRKRISIVLNSWSWLVSNFVAGLIALLLYSCFLWRKELIFYLLFV